MNANEVEVWIRVAQMFFSAGVSVANSLRTMMGAAHPNLTPEQIDAAYAAILQDDAVRAAFAKAASQQ